jgi:hypothetical protein
LFTPADLKQVRRAFREFSEVENMVTAVLNESERIREQTEKTIDELNTFLEYKFHATYNIENIFQLKQGQVRLGR